MKKTESRKSRDTVPLKMDMFLIFSYARILRQRLGVAL
jgi:hypothetical protein